MQFEEIYFLLIFSSQYTGKDFDGFHFPVSTEKSKPPKPLKSILIFHAGHTHIYPSIYYPISLDAARQTVHHTSGVCPQI